jgi:Rrf2 family protein
MVSIMVRTGVKLLNRDTDYAVRALLRIAANPASRLPVSELSRRLNIPRPFLRKIFQTLQKAGVVLSRKGKGGGFVLAAAPQEIFLARVMEVFQGPLELSHCLYGDELCVDIKTCPLRRRILALEKAIQKDIQTITLQSLLDERRKNA